MADGTIRVLPVAAFRNKFSSSVTRFTVTVTRFLLTAIMKASFWMGFHRTVVRMGGGGGKGLCEVSKYSDIGHGEKSYLKRMHNLKLKHLEGQFTADICFGI